MAYTTTRKTYLIFTPADVRAELDKCKTAEDKRQILSKEGVIKSYCLHGFWSEGAIRRFAERRTFKGAITVKQWLLNHSKYGLDRLEKLYEMEV